MPDAADPLSVIESVRRACAEAGEHDPLDEAAQLHLKHGGLDGLEVVLAGEQGFAVRRGEQLDLAVAPRERRQGHGRDLADRALAQGTATVAWSHGNHPAAQRLAEHHGFTRARDLWVMRRPATDPLPALTVPPGIRIRSFTDADADGVVRVNAAAFADHPEQGQMDRTGLDQRMAEDWFDATGLLVAIDDAGDLLGFHWTKRHDAHTGEVYVVGIDPRTQGRGLGRSLTLAGLHHLAEGGVTETLLYVESDNAAALRVYSGLGFTHAEADTHVQYRR